MHNVANARVPLALGDLQVNAEFKNGNIQNGIPASLITSDPRIQMAIENDKRYFGRLIKLEWAHPDPSDEKPRGSEAGGTTMSAEDVKTIDDVKAYLIKNHNVARNISSLETIKNKVAELGLKFPNFNFD